MQVEHMHTLWPGNFSSKCASTEMCSKGQWGCSEQINYNSQNWEWHGCLSGKEDEKVWWIHTIECCMEMRMSEPVQHQVWQVLQIQLRGRWQTLECTLYDSIYMKLKPGKISWQYQKLEKWLFWGESWVGRWELGNIKVSEGGCPRLFRLLSKSTIDWAAKTTISHNSEGWKFWNQATNSSVSSETTSWHRRTY